MGSNTNTNDNPIIITNLQDEETISYSLCLIKGFIQSKTELTGEITAYNHSKETDNKTNWILIKNSFKCLIEMQKGINKLTIEYLHFSYKLNLTYRPLNTEYCVLPVYIICEGHDGYFQAPQNCKNTPEDACARIALGAKLIQTVYAEKMHESNLGRKTFQLEREVNPEIGECVVFKSCLNIDHAKKMNEMDLWVYFGRELMRSTIASDKRKYLAFISCTWYDGSKLDLDKALSHETIVKMTEAHAALGGGGLAVFGSACLHTWPQNTKQILGAFTDDTKIDKSILMDDSCYRGTYGACFTTTLGSVCHELGHTLDLGHTEDGIMNRGFDNIDLVFTIPKNVIKKSNKLNTVRPISSKISMVPIIRNFEVSFVPGCQINKQRSSVQNKKYSTSMKYSCIVECDKKTDDGNEIINYELPDLTYFTRNCVLILYYHRWFNAEQNKDCHLTYNFENKEISSGAGIRIVEIRSKSTEFVETWWEFTGMNRRYKFTIPGSVLNNNSVLFVEDSYGKILKHPL